MIYLDSIIGYTSTSVASPTSIKTLVNTTPLVSGIKSCTAFRNYAMGIFSTRDCSTADHSVLIVGYTATSWKIKNSWGTTWGESGFGHVLIKEHNDFKLLAPTLTSGGYLTIQAEPLYKAVIGTGATDNL